MKHAVVEKESETRDSVTSLVVPRIGRDEMNLIEFPLGPIKNTGLKSWESTHVVRDRQSKRIVERKVLITAADSFGLPRPIDEQVLIALKALTFENKFASPKVHFSRYQLCRTLGWQADGRAYKRLEDSFDRLVGTTFKYRDAWWDNSEKSWRTVVFHLLDNVELCSNSRYQQFRKRHNSRSHALCFFVWNEVIWKSFNDGYIRKIDMDTFRRIASGRRREVPLRLYRWLQKRFYWKTPVKIDAMKLGIGTLGLSVKYPSDCVRVLKRASKVLIDCRVLGDVKFARNRNSPQIDVTFIPIALCRKKRRKRAKGRDKQAAPRKPGISSWFQSHDSSQLLQLESAALESEFGKKFERELVLSARGKKLELTGNEQIRLQYIRRYQAMQEKFD